MVFKHTRMKEEKRDNYNNFDVVTAINCGSVAHSGSAAQIIYISLFF